MEMTNLRSADFWESETNEVRLNPAAQVDVSDLREALLKKELKSSIILATSGTSGTMKLVVLPKTAMLSSARAVNDWCGITASDRWLGGLSTFHVGGLGIFCRA
jgi:o-succinylbenzoate---CoA ligase